MRFKFACADFAFPLVSHDDALRIIKSLGMDGVDIGLFEDRSHLYPSTEFANLAQNAKNLKEKLNANGLVCADVFMQTALDFDVKAINHPDEKIRKEQREMFLKNLEYANLVGSRHVTGLPGYMFNDGSMALCIEELCWRTEKAREAGLTYSFEAHCGGIVDTPEAVLNLLNAAGGGVSLTLDYTHFIRHNIANERAHKLIPYASHLHFRGAAPGKLQCIVKENEIDYKTIVHELIQRNYEGFIGIEYTYNEWENCNRTDNISETILMKRLVEQLAEEG